jgi:hypothetical protein
LSHAILGTNRDDQKFAELERKVSSHDQVIVGILATNARRPNVNPVCIATPIGTLHEVSVQHHPVHCRNSCPPQKFDRASEMGGGRNCGMIMAC